MRRVLQAHIRKALRLCAERRILVEDRDYGHPIEGSDSKDMAAQNGRVALHGAGAQKYIIRDRHHPMEKSFVSYSGDCVVCVWDYDELA
jgi:hypothetical protein